MYLFPHGASSHYLRRIQCRRRTPPAADSQLSRAQGAPGWGHCGCSQPGRHRLYQTNAQAIRPLHEWASTFEKFWQHQLIRVKERAEEKSAQSGFIQNPQEIPKEER
jgi:hypothetical protein